jgi:hypothetical protein
VTEKVPDFLAFPWLGNGTLQESRAAPEPTIWAVPRFKRARDADAVSFYKKYGLLELPDVERRLFLPSGDGCGTISIADSSHFL